MALQLSALFKTGHIKRGTILYSPMIGDVVVNDLREACGEGRQAYVLNVSHPKHGICSYDFYDDGTFVSEGNNPQCMLYPSREKRKWDYAECIYTREPKEYDGLEYEGYLVKVADILKNAKREELLFSPIFGEVRFWGIVDTGHYGDVPYDWRYHIIVGLTANFAHLEQFDPYGRYHSMGECMLFPQWHYDWERYKKEKEKVAKTKDQL